jgi:hypothetical protein
MKTKGTTRIKSTQIRWFSGKSGGVPGPLEQWPKATQGGQSGLSTLRSDGSCDGQAGKLDHVRGGQKTLKAKLNLKRDKITKIGLVTAQKESTYSFSGDVE